MVCESVSVVPSEPIIVPSESSREFQRGVGRARALLRQAFGHWPGVPVVCDLGSIVWRHGTSAATQLESPVDGLRLRSMEQTLTCLVHHHAEHLEFVLPDAANWLQRASNCLELLKEFLHKPPSTQSDWFAAVNRLLIATRWKQRIFELARRWPKLQPLLWHLCFVELTSRTSGRLTCLSWLEAQAPSLVSLMARPDGVQVALMLHQVGPHIDARWLQTTIEFLADESLGETPYLLSFAYADDLAQALRHRLKEKPLKLPQRRAAASLDEKFLSQLRSFHTMKPNAISKITALLGALVSDGLSQWVHQLNSRARQAEKRLHKELHKIEQLGVQPYIQVVGWQRAIAGAHVLSNLREESQSLLDLFALADGLAADTRVAVRLPTATAFFNQMAQLKLACRVRLAWQWHECGWRSVTNYLDGVNELISRRGCHNELVKHWQRRLLPSVRADHKKDLVVAAVCKADRAGRHRSIQLLEHLVYECGERLTDSAVLAIMNLAAAVPSLDAAVDLYRKVDLQVLARAESRELDEAHRMSADASEFRMALAWFRHHPEVVSQISTLRCAFTQSEHRDLLQRLLNKRDHATIKRWSEYVELLDSMNGDLPECTSLTDAPAWVQCYPEAFRDLLFKLSQVCEDAERVAADLLREVCPSRERMLAEIENLTALLSDCQWASGQTPERLARIVKRIENIRQRQAEPPVVSPERALRLIEKLSQRVDREMFSQMQELARRSLEASLGELNMEGLRERLQQSPYDRILPALKKLKTRQQQVALRALRSSWDNSLKLLSEPANQRFIQQMLAKGLNLDAWLSSELSLEGRRADGTPYRVAFTQDPLDILLMGHHFDTCLALNGSNFHSTVANLVDANKRVLYGRTDNGQVVGRCLFALTNAGQLQSFHRYQHCAEDGFDRVVDEFAERLVERLGTAQTESGQVSCLVSCSWYDDGCVAVPTSPRGKCYRLQELIKSQPDANVYELALQVFGSNDDLIQAASSLWEFSVFGEQRAVRGLAPKLLDDQRIALSLRLRLAKELWEAGDKEIVRSVLTKLEYRDIYRSLGRETLNDLIGDRNFVDLIVEHDRALAKRLFIRSRRRYVRNEEQDASVSRRYMRDKLAAVGHLSRRR